MWTGWLTRPIVDANRAAQTAAEAASQMAVLLITVGQSQAGGIAQLQAAYVAASSPEQHVSTGFGTFKAGFLGPSIRRLGLEPAVMDGVSFFKNVDRGSRLN
jgi:hypothetical protein